MPPKPRFTREEIVDAALEVVSDQGVDALTARTLAKRLGCSTRPIFTVFNDMEELKRELCGIAARRIEERSYWVMEQTDSLVQTGVQVVRIACEEPNLFNLVFAYGEFDDTLVPTSRGTAQSEVYVNHVRNNYDLSEKGAIALLHHVWMYLSGMGSQCAIRHLYPSREEVELTLGESISALAASAQSGGMRERTAEEIVEAWRGGRYIAQQGGA